MPIYEYHCPRCDKPFEALVSRHDADVECPSCGSKKVEKQLSGFAVGGSDGRSDYIGDAPACPPGTGGCGRCM
ncbi:MAG: zinc ribbon domain-containing protein [Myxococcales bacterium]|nr:zinc ribbon domain-containing protein [Myxococcales bacterium]